MMISRGFSFKKIVPKPWRRAVVLIAGLFLLAVIPGTYFALRNPGEVQATWFNTSWGFRKKIPITTHSSPETNVYFAVTVDTSDTTKFQADCGDIRMTNFGGDLLKYYIVSGCGTGSTVLHVLVPNFPAGVQNFYMYYGNPSAPNGFSAADFPNAATVTVGSVATEENGAGPIAYWRFNEGTGTTAHDQTTNGNNGTLGAGGTTPTWKTSDVCISGKCLYFDGGDVVTANTNSSLKVQASTLSGWVKLNGFTGINHMMIASYANNITSSGVEWGISGSGYLSYAYNDGSVRGWYEDTATPLALNKWYFVSIVWDKTNGQVSFYINGVLSSTVATTTGTIAYGSESFLVGYQSQNDYLNGWVDELRLYGYNQTAAQIRSSYQSAVTSAGVGSAIGNQGALSSGLVGYWKMDEASWTVNCSTGSVIDSSGNGNNGASCPSSTGPTGGAPGKYGNAGLFDGTNDYVAIPSSTSLNLATDMTVSAWVKSTDTSYSSRLIVSKWNGGGAKNYWFGRLYDRTIGFQVDGGSSSVFANDSTVVDGNWHLVTGVANSKAKKIYLYIDGSLVNSASYSGTSATGSTQVEIGRNNESVNDLWNGSIDDTRIYNRPLSSSEITQLYNTAPGPVGYWPLDEKTGTIADDISGSGNTGTLSNSPARVAGKFGTALSMSAASSQSVSAADSTSLSITGSLTIASWINPASNTAATEYPITGKAPAYWMTQYGDEIRVYIGSTSNYVTTNSTNLAVGTWYYVTGVYNAPAQTVSIYVNGVLQTATTTGTIPSSIGDGSDSFQIGLTSTPGTLSRGTTTAYTSSDSFGTGNYTTSSFTPPSNSLLVVTVGTMGNGTSSDMTACMTISDSQGLSWTARNSAGSTSAWSASIKTWTAPVTTGTSMTITTGCGGTNIFSYKVRVTPYTTYDTSTPTGVTASDGNGPTNGAYTITLSGSPASSSEVLASFFADKDNGVTYDVTPGTGWTEISDDSTNSNDLESQVRSGSTSTSVTWNDVQASATLPYKTFASAIEIRAGTANSYYNGVIDEVKVYNYTRSQSQITEDMNGSHPVGGSPIGSQLLYLKMDEQSGTLLHNSSGVLGNSITGTLTNMAAPATSTSGWAPSGKVNSGLVFDGSNDYVEFAHQSAMDQADSFSMSAWVSTTTLTGNDHWIISQGDATKSNYWMDMCVAGGDAGCSAPAFECGGGYNGSAGNSVSSPYPIAINTWYHLTCVMDDSANTIKLYVNGKLAATSASATVDPSTAVNSGPIRIGRERDTFGYYWNGKIDEVKFYSSALTADQVAIDYNYGSSNSSGGVLGTTEAADINIDGAGAAPLGYWNFDDKYGTSALDRSGNNYTATLTNGPTWGPGKVGSAVNFDGTNDIAQVASSDFSLVGAGNFTINTWVKPHTLSSSVNSRILTYKQDATNGYHLGIISSASGTCASRFIFEVDKAGTYYASGCSTSNTAAVAGNWYHITGVFNGGTNTATLYINGIPQVAGSTQSLGLGVTTTLTWASQSTGGSNLFDGAIDETKIYNYARTVGQIAYDYNRGAPLAWWKLDDCQGTSLADSSGNGSTGTLSVNGGGSYTAPGSCVSGTATDTWYASRVGKFNSAIAVEGNDTVTMGNPTILQMERTDPRTFSIWLKTTTNNSFSLMTKQADAAPYAGYNFQTGGAGLLDFQLVNTYPSNTLEMRTANDTHYYDGNWHMATVTYDGSSTTGGVKIYIDGKNQVLAISNQSLTSSIATSANFYLGSRSATGQQFPGQLDDARIYPYAMSDNQVKKLYNDGAAVYYGPATGAP